VTPWGPAPAPRADPGTPVDPLQPCCWGQGCWSAPCARAWGKQGAQGQACLERGRRHGSQRRCTWRASGHRGGGWSCRGAQQGRGRHWRCGRGRGQLEERCRGFRGGHSEAHLSAVRRVFLPSEPAAPGAAQGTGAPDVHKHEPWEGPCPSTGNLGRCNHRHNVGPERTAQLPQGPVLLSTHAHKRHAPPRTHAGNATLGCLAPPVCSAFTRVCTTAFYRTA